MEHFIFSDLVFVVADESCVDQVRLRCSGSRLGGLCMPRGVVQSCHINNTNKLTCALPLLLVDPICST